jgi:hypothetical protein
MRKVTRLTESDLSRLVKKVINEDKSRKELFLRDKLNDIFFGQDKFNISSEQGEFGYLSPEHRLSKKVSPRQLVGRIEQVIGQLEDYIQHLRTLIPGEEAFTKNPRYSDIWKDVEEDL